MRRNQPLMTMTILITLKNLKVTITMPMNMVTNTRMTIMTMPRKKQIPTADVFSQVSNLTLSSSSLQSGKFRSLSWTLTTSQRL